MKAKTTTQRGLGWKHQQETERLKKRHRDGTLCWWCDEPMFLDRNRNWDGMVLHGDHSRSRDHGGTKTDRLLHGKCNLSRGNGERDHLRPAATGSPVGAAPVDLEVLGVRAMPWPAWPPP